MAVACLGFALGALTPATSIAPFGNPLPVHDTAASPGDWVEFHVTVRGAQGELFSTSDPQIARSAEAAGVEPIFPNYSFPHRRPANTTIPDPQIIAEAGAQRFHPALFLIGGREGQTVYTPFIWNPLGENLRPVLPVSFGPVSRQVELNLSAVFLESASNLQYGDRSDYVVGNIVPYAGTLSGRVDSRRGDLVMLTIIDEEDSVVFSPALGMALTVTQGQGGLFLEPVLAVGETFSTAGCDLPANTLRPGTYRVSARFAEGYRLERVIGEDEAIFLGPFSYELRILEIRQGMK